MLARYELTLQATRRPELRTVHDEARHQFSKEPGPASRSRAG